MTMPDKRPGRHAARRDTPETARAKTVCASCPVLEDCRGWALTLPDPAVGMIAGGLTPEDRQRVRRRAA